MDILSGQLDLNIVYRLSVAAILGGMIGIERELHGKVAGFRTHALVALGAAVFTVTSVHIFEVYGSQVPVDPGRIAAQIVSGVGFLGAGAIIRSHTGIHGLTTAAGIWTAAAIGLACGLGYFNVAVSGTVIALVILIAFSWVGRKIGARDV